MKYSIERREKLEEKILSMIMGFSNYYMSILDNYSVTEKYFRKAEHKDIMLAIERCIKQGLPTSIDNVPFQYEQKFSSIDKANIFQEVIRIGTQASTHASLIDDIRQLRKYKMADDLEFMFMKYQNVDFDTLDIEDYIEESINGLEESKSSVKVLATKTMAEHVKDALKSAELNSNKFKAKGIIGVPTGFDRIDSFSGGILDGELTIIGARPSMGKTTYALNIAQNASLRGYKPLFFSLEMSATSLMFKMFSSHTNIDAKRLFLGKTSDDDWVRLNQGAGILEKTNMILEDKTYGLDAIISKIRYHKRKDNVSIVFIDYLQLIRVTKGHSREQEVAEISGRLKQLTLELNMPIVALSQLSRPAKGTIVKRPQLDTLRESGALEQDADTVIFVHRPEYYMNEEEITEEERNVTEIIYAKGRNIGIGLFKLKFNKEKSKFEEDNSFF